MLVMSGMYGAFEWPIKMMNGWLMRKYNTINFHLNYVESGLDSILELIAGVMLVNKPSK